MKTSEDTKNIVPRVMRVRHGLVGRLQLGSRKPSFLQKEGENMCKGLSANLKELSNFKTPAPYFFREKYGSARVQASLAQQGMSSVS